MISQLYVNDATRRKLKSQIQSFGEIYFQKLLPVFNNIEDEADNLENEFYDDFMHQPAHDEYIDPSAIAEQSLNIGIEHYSYLRMGKYNLIASWHAMLYQLWEQQSRSFLFREMSHIHKIEFQSFCTNLAEIKRNYKFHNVRLEQFTCWTRIKELCLLCNVIKHGDGDSAKKLRKIKPEMFKQEAEVDYMDAYRTTLMEETLNITDITLNNYREALLSFWDEIPERNYSSE